MMALAFVSAVTTVDAQGCLSQPIRLALPFAPDGSSDVPASVQASGAKVD